MSANVNVSLVQPSGGAAASVGSAVPSQQLFPFAPPEFRLDLLSAGSFAEDPFASTSIGGIGIPSFDAKRAKEIPSPHTLAVCILLHIYVLPPTEDDESELAGVPSFLKEQIWPHSARLPASVLFELVCFLSQEVEQVTEYSAERTLSELISLIKEFASDEAENIAIILVNVFSSVTSPDAVMDIFASLEEFFLRPASTQPSFQDGRPAFLEKDSLFGQFLRRVSLLSTRLLFEDVADLYEVICEYVEDYRASNTVDHPSPIEQKASLNDSGMSIDMDMSQDSDLSIDKHASPVSSRERGVEETKEELTHTPEKQKSLLRIETASKKSLNPPFGRLISSEQMQRYLKEKIQTLSKTIGTVSREETEEEISKILKIHPTLPEAFLLQYLNNLHHREFKGAVDSLHRYFDFAMYEHQHKLQIAAAERDNSNPEAAPTSLPPSATFTAQYAILNLAELHVEFGHTQEALDCIHETVKIAQQHDDHACVAFALSALYRIVSASGKGGEAEKLLHQLLKRASDLNIPKLQAIASLAAAEREVMNPSLEFRQAQRDGSAAEVRQALQGSRGSHIWDLLHQPSIIAATRANQMDEMSVALEQEMASKSLLLRATTWELVGQRALAQVAVQLQLHCYGHAAPVEDVKLATIKKSYYHFLGQTNTSPCVYASALDTLIKFKSLCSKDIDGQWSEAMANVLFEWCLFRGDLLRAQIMLKHLRSLAVWAPNSPGKLADADMKSILLLAHQGQFKEAIKQIHRLSTFCEEKSLKVKLAGVHYLHARVLLMSCRTMPTMALMPLMDCLALAKKLGLDSLRAMATLAVAQLHLSSGSWESAKALIDSVIVHIRCNCDVGTQAEAYLLFAKCHIVRANRYLLEDREPETVASLLEQSLVELKKSEDLFKTSHSFVGLKELYYVKARVYDELEQTKERDEAADNFVRISKKLDANSDRPFESIAFLKIEKDDKVLQSLKTQFAEEFAQVVK